MDRVKTPSDDCWREPSDDGWDDVVPPRKGGHDHPRSKTTGNLYPQLPHDVLDLISVYVVCANKEDAGGLVGLVLGLRMPQTAV